MLSKLKQGFQNQEEVYKPLVLVVDDDSDNLLFACCIIESLGMNYAVTDNSEECLNLIHELLPDVLLLDIVMPKLDGLEIARTIRQDKIISHIPIVAITGLTKPQDKDKIIAAGCDDYLCKPYMIEELESKIYGCLKCHWTLVQK